jgi:dTDP-4-amino-4,6-dideoxygalactose transaminase
MREKIKLFEPVTNNSEIKSIVKVIKSGYWASGAGFENVSKFEKAFTKYTGAKSCVTVNSGTAALHLALSLINVKNKEVIVPSNSFVATAHCVTYNGGKPIFVDVDPKTLCLDINLIERAISTKTRAIIPVHFGGMPCDLVKLSEICKNHKLDIIEDAAHAAGAKQQKKKIGSHTPIVCFSFHPVKNLAMPSGGAITLNGIDSMKNEKILKIRRWCGISNRKDTKYDVSDLGWNYYMNEFSAAIGIEQLKKLNELNNKRKKIARRYSYEISLESKMPFNSDCSYHLYWIQVRNRNYFMKKMNENGIETGIHYRPIHKMKFYKNNSNLPVSEKVGKCNVTLPIHPKLSENDVDKIISLTNKFALED